MPKYRTAAQLGILPEERKALIAFVEAPSLGRMVAVNGRAHFYDQSVVDEKEVAENHQCGTAGCVAGFVFAHARHVQGKRRLRGGSNAETYFDAATNVEYDADYNEKPDVPLLCELFQEGNPRELKKAKKVVAKMLTTGRVDWD